MSSQDLVTIKPENRPTDLLQEVENLKFQGYRILQICRTRVPEGFELTYSFDKDYELKNLRFTLADGEGITSITSLYLPAFVCENEIHDLFGVPINHIAKGLDFGGKFFRLAEKTPWHDLPKGGAH